MSAPPERPSHAELMAMLEAPDLTPRERRELRRAARMQRRIETWEARRATPVRGQPHRVVISLVLMAACLGLLWLLLAGSPG